MSVSDRVKIIKTELLSNDWYILKKIEFSWKRRDGNWQTVSRETYDRGNGAVLLPCDVERRKVMLIKQFRLPTYVNGNDDLLIEAPAGLLDGKNPAERIREEVSEETGLELGEVKEIFSCYMSPGSVTERVHFFIAEYDLSSDKGTGGGLVEEGEDIERFEVDIDVALKMIETGEICDAKTIMLLQHAVLTGVFA